jgi:hypothetical protein
MRAVENRDFKQETHCLHIIPKLHGNWKLELSRDIFYLAVFY